MHGGDGAMPDDALTDAATAGHQPAADETRALLSLFERLAVDPEIGSTLALQSLPSAPGEGRLLRGVRALLERVERAEQAAARGAGAPAVGADELPDEHVADRTRELSALLEVSHSLTSIHALEPLL